MAMADPFYLVKEEVQDSLNKVQDMLERWQNLSSNLNERALVRKELVAGCESVEWQVDELEKAIAVAERDPSRFGIDAVEIAQRRKWTSSMHSKVLSIRGALQEASQYGTNNLDGMRRELMRMQDNRPGSQPNSTFARGNDDFVETESDSQALILRAQDEELDELSASVERIGDVGLTIHEELGGQEKIVSELDKSMEATVNRIGLVQKKMSHVIKKAGAKGQILMIIFLVALLLFLIFMVIFG